MRPSRSMRSLGMPDEVVLGVLLAVHLHAARIVVGYYMHC